jgi:hypothetical protein
MNDDYLWDGSSEPDPEIRRLESALGRFRHNRPAPHFPERTGLRDWLRPKFSLPRLASVAAVAVVVFAAWRAERSATLTARSGWEVTRLAGEPKIGAHPLKAAGRAGRLGVGQLLETDTISRAQIRVGDIGQVEVEPSSRLRLVAARRTENRLALERGAIHAFIFAPPRLFFVNTPSSTAVDLGCAYSLQVDDRGAGLLRVTFGWVELQARDRESLIPAGAAALTRPGIGPGTPYFEDASASFISALEKLDFGPADTRARAAALEVLLAEARPRDAFTLLNLLWRVSANERDVVYNRLAQLVPPPPGVDRQHALRGDGRVIGLWWDRMGVGHPKKK